MSLSNGILAQHQTPKPSLAQLFKCCWDFNIKCLVQVHVTEHLVPRCWYCLGGCETFGDGTVLEEVGYKVALRFYSLDLLSAYTLLCGDVGKQLYAPDARAFFRRGCCYASSVLSNCGQNQMLYPQTVSQKSNTLIKPIHWVFGHSFEKNS